MKVKPYLVNSVHGKREGFNAIVFSCLLGADAASFAVESNEDGKKIWLLRLKAPIDCGRRLTEE